MFCLKCGKSLPDESVFCLYCGAQLPSHVEASDVQAPMFSDPMPNIPSAAARHCLLCGRELPQTSISDLCITCLNNRSFVADAALEDEIGPLPDPVDLPEPELADSRRKSAIPFQLELDLDDEYPPAFAEATDLTAPQKKRKGKRWVIVLVALLVLVTGAVLLFPRIYSAVTGEPPSLGVVAGQSNLEKKVIAYARAMNKAACANPDTAKYHQDETLTQQGNSWIITETFDRTDWQGQFVTDRYIATLRLDSTAKEGYLPIKLQIGSEVMYDYSSKDTG